VAAARETSEGIAVVGDAVAKPEGLVEVAEAMRDVTVDGTAVAAEAAADVTAVVGEEWAKAIVAAAAAVAGAKAVVRAVASVAPLALARAAAFPVAVLATALLGTQTVGQRAMRCGTTREHLGVAAAWGRLRWLWARARVVRG
jgi:hypothetical protein